ncbi:MAG TPA: SUF system Fe-S cluster assembly protein [Usitatibacter sp.]|jgi:FeS assembly SUF system protein|nr:SUF system Fe-S cluster assembly protein [Usitatibacter sp.]
MEEQLRDNVIAALRTVYDPEIPINIYDLGLVYEIDLKPEGRVDIRMTLTAPACPVAGEMPGVVEDRVMQVPDVSEVRVDLVWEPPWTRDMLSEEAKLQLGLL